MQPNPNSTHVGTAKVLGHRLRRAAGRTPGRWLAHDTTSEIHGCAVAPNGETPSGKITAFQNLSLANIASGQEIVDVRAAAGQTTRRCLGPSGPSRRSG